MRFRNRECLQPQRNSLSTALSLPALREYLQRECGMTQFNQQIWETLTPRLHTAQGIVVCDTYGNRELLKRPLLPVVCHRKDKFLFERQKQLCLAAAAEGAVLVSARIAKGEQDIIHAAIFEGNPVITVDDNGFAELYHPSEERMALCMENSLLIVTPWRFTYRHAEDAISVCECKAMNCVVQAICKKKDSWWKETD